MSDELYASINIIDALSDKISAVLDLMMMAESSVDHKSVKTAAEMCLTMHDELKEEIAKIEAEWREANKAKKSDAMPEVVEIQNQEEVEIVAAAKPVDTCEKKNIDKGKVKALHDAGWSQAKIADEMGVSAGRICQILKEVK